LKELFDKLSSSLLFVFYNYSKLPRKSIDMSHGFASEDYVPFVNS